MSNQMIPNPDPNGPTPEIGGDRGDPIGEHRIGPVTTQAPAVAAAPEADKPNTQTMGEGERYWYEKAQALMVDNAKLAPLGQYAEVIDYLDRNEAAVDLVVSHMRGQAPPTNDDFVNDFDRDLGQPERMENGAQHTAPKPPQALAKPNMSELQLQLRAQYDALLLEKGMPEHDKDRFVQFLMNPGDLKPEELVEMFTQLQGMRNAPNDNTPIPQAGQAGTEMRGASSNPAIPPMSVAGINGGSEDPLLAAEADARAKTRIMIDPNNL